MNYLSGGTLLSPKDILNAKIRLKLPDENSYYETDFKDFFAKKSTEILEKGFGEQLFGHLKSLHSTLMFLEKHFSEGENNNVEFLLPDVAMPVPYVHDLLPPTDGEDN
jgi:hypothetical protein